MFLRKILNLSEILFSIKFIKILILSFALQNNIHFEPFLLKTPRYLSISNYINLGLFSLLLNLTLYNYMFYNIPFKFLKILFNYQYRKGLYISYNRVLKYSKTLYANNIIKSSEFLLLKSLNSTFIKNKQSLYLKTQWFLFINIIKPITFIPLSFQKKNFNKFIFFLIFLVTELYVTLPSTFQLIYHYIFIKSNFTILAFINNYYFKVKRI